jgi:hypothetical protein
MIHFNNPFTGRPVCQDHRTYYRSGWHTFESKPGGPMRGRIFRTVKCLSCGVEVFSGGADSGRRNGWQSLIDRAAKAVHLHVAETAAKRPADMPASHWKVTHAQTGNSLGYWKGVSVRDALMNARDCGGLDSVLGGDAAPMDQLLPHYLVEPV